MHTTTTRPMPKYVLARVRSDPVNPTMVVRRAILGNPSVVDDAQADLRYPAT